jgi:hypothetical protein
LHWIGAENSTSGNDAISQLPRYGIRIEGSRAFSQFSRFLRPGAQRNKACGRSATVILSTPLNANGSVAVYINYSSTAAAVVDAERED